MRTPDPSEELEEEEEEDDDEEELYKTQTNGISDGTSLYRSVTKARKLHSFRRIRTDLKRHKQKRMTQWDILCLFC